jgi:coproporphyrinogen III oxidase
MLTIMNINIGDKEKIRVETWFTQLRNQICQSFEFLERNHAHGPFMDLKPGTFEQKKNKASQ